MGLHSVGTPGLWIAFTVIVLVTLVLDLGVFHRKAHAVRMREAVTWTLVWIVLALSFTVGVWQRFGAEKALEFLTGYVIEYSLSVDNLFVFLVIFSYFSVPAVVQHRVLFWGIFGAVVMRGIFIVIGAALLQAFHWVMFLFGAFLVFTGIKLLFQHEEDVHPERNPVVRLLQRLVPAIPHYRGGAFIVVENGRRYATPLLLVLATVEVTDVIFATDSIPAIFAITTDPFIVYTSNIFAILGLRSLFFVLASMMEKFHYLKIGLALVLAFVGVKMLIVDLYKIPIAVSLSVVAALLTAAVATSLLRPPTKAPLPEHPPHVVLPGVDGREAD